MAARACQQSLLIKTIVVFSFISAVNSVYFRRFESISDCLVGPSDNPHEFFDISQLLCTECSQGTDLQTVSADGLRCICQPGTKIVRDFGGTAVTCEACPDDLPATSANGWECVACGTNNPFNPATRACTPCPESEITVERSLDGTATGAQDCTACVETTSPDFGNTRCTRCNQVLSVVPSATTCQCPEGQEAGGLCFSSTDDIIGNNADLYVITYPGSLEVDSKYFFDNLRAADAMCRNGYSNLTACQTLGNMCVAIMYTRDNEGDTNIVDACAAYLDIASSGGGTTPDWPANMPWLYYLEDPTETILSDTRITTEYTFPNSRLKFKAAKYTMNGTFLGLVDINGGDLQFCKASDSILDAAFIFGTTYQRECTISAKDLWDEDKHETVFYDMYLEFEQNQVTQLYAVPVLVVNYGGGNAGNSRSEWQLTRRFFLVDNISGKPVTSTSAVNQNRNGDQEARADLARAVRYAQEMTVHVALQQDAGNGRIYPPFITINYGVATIDDYDADTSLSVSFNVEYTMDLSSYDDDVSIAVGVLSAFAFAFAFVQAWCWSKRTGRIAIDFVTLVKFVLFILGNLANVFFVVMFGASLWWLIFYKRQKSVHLIVPTADQESDFVAFLASAFALKLIQLIHIIAIQVSVDIFFVDWERPRGKVSSGGDAGGQKGVEAPVSIWRTYFIANEWNEIQTTRKTNSLFQIFCTLFFLNVVGFENVTSSDPNGDLSRDSDKYYAPDSRIFRFAVAALVYVLVAVAQWIFYTFIYERFIDDKVRNYVDLCSMSNVSVFILENSQFGYYIHGRSVHGRSDTDMREMHENLRREEDDLCGKRGLMPNTDQQTFQMAVPLKLRNQYDKVMAPINNPMQAAPMLRGERGPGDSSMDQLTIQKISAYSILNRFLQAFVDHSLREVDYIIKDKLLLESVLNMEFTDTTDKGFLYNDDGHSFDQVLFYGHESLLIVFEVLLFGVVDLAAKNYVLSAVILYIIMELINTVRDSLGRKNLATKTLVDQRFLI